MVAIYTPRNEEPAIEPEAGDEAAPVHAAGDHGWPRRAPSRWEAPDDPGTGTAPVVALDDAFAWSDPAPERDVSQEWAANAGARRRHPAAARSTRGNLAIADITAAVEWAPVVVPADRSGGVARPGTWTPDHDGRRGGATDEAVPGAGRPVVRPLPDRATRVRRLPDRATRVRRRRLVVLVGLVVLTIALVAGVRALASLSAVPSSPAPTPVDGGTAPVPGRTYVVQPGDTLWSIARRVAPDRDPRPVVDALRRANGGPDLQVGSSLTIPGG
jgi:LysM domain